MNIKKIVLSVIIAILAFMFHFFVLPWLILALGSLLDAKPQTPKVTQGEFPFELVYEVDNKTVSETDTLVIEHEGVKWNEGLGKYNTWDTYILNSTVELYKSYNEILIKKGQDDDVGRYTITFYLGSCEYYMGLKEVEISLDVVRNIYPGSFKINSTHYTGPIDEQTLYEKYNIKIIKKNISAPLVDNVK